MDLRMSIAPLSIQGPKSHICVPYIQMLSQRETREDDVIFCYRVISACSSHLLKFLVFLWSQVFFSAAPQFPEVSADNCSAPSLAQSLKIFSLPIKKTRISGPAQKALA